jgi:hypothetical protein
MWPNPLMLHFKCGKGQPEHFGCFVIFNKLAKVINPPLGEKRPNLVTLLSTIS